MGSVTTALSAVLQDSLRAKQSSRKVDALMQDLFDMMIRRGAVFERSEFLLIERHANGRAWLGAERHAWHSLACITGNKSAALAFEHSYGQAPWIWPGEIFPRGSWTPAKLDRLFVGAKILFDGQDIEITSMCSAQFIGCVYDPEVTYPRRPVRRLTIDRARFNATKKALKKSLADDRMRERES